MQEVFSDVFGQIFTCLFRPCLGYICEVLKSMDVVLVGIKTCFWLTLTMSVSSVESWAWNCAPFEFHLEDFPLNFQSLQWLNTYTIRSAGMFKFNHTVSRTVVTSRHYPVDVDAVCMRGNRIMMNGVLLTQEWNTMSGRRVLWQTHKPRCTSCFFFLFWVAISTVTATQPVLSVTELFCEKREVKKKKKKKRKKRERTRNGREKKESKRALKLDDM